MSWWSRSMRCPRACARSCCCVGFEGLPPRRIARELGLQVATVWSRLHQALVALRQQTGCGA